MPSGGRSYKGSRKRRAKSRLKFKPRMNPFGQQVAREMSRRPVMSNAVPRAGDVVRGIVDAFRQPMVRTTAVTGGVDTIGQNIRVQLGNLERTRRRAPSTKPPQRKPMRRAPTSKANRRVVSRAPVRGGASSNTYRPPSARAPSSPGTPRRLGSRAVPAMKRRTNTLKRNQMQRRASRRSVGPRLI